MSWLDDLKAGDPVIVVSGHGSTYRCATVTHRDKVKIVVDTQKYSAKSGYALNGNQWNRAHLTEATSERVQRATEQADRERYSMWLRGIHYRTVPVSALRAAWDAYNRAIAEHLAAKDSQP